MSLILIFLASITGSLHCVAMCGGFSALALNSGHSVRNHCLYHGGRLVTYLLLGLVAGSLGSNLDRVGSDYGLTHLATLCTAALLILAGIFGLLRGYVIQVSLVPHSITKIIQRVIKALQDRPAFMPFALGLLTTLLPCGWLYTYLVVAAGTGSPRHALVVMAAFWAGTVPSLLITGGLATVVTSPLRKHAPLIASLLMLTAGTYSLLTHINSSMPGKSTPHSCAMHPAVDKDPKN